MLRQKDELNSKADAILAPYAIRNCGTGKRIHPENEHPLRTNFQRDRDRILHSRAFRRLEYKTQVFLSGSGDHLRNRLTHTIEVAAIARTFARALALNEDLTETIALAHDLGHTPFGHAGERALHTLMHEYGGFDHNLQALRVVDFLEIKYPDYDGVNLTKEARAGLCKHRTEGETTLDGIALPPSGSLEAQTADLADDLTYYGHDVDDGLDSGIITPEMMDGLEIWQKASALVKKKDPSATGERFTAYAVRCLIDMMVGDAVRYSAKLIEEAAPSSPGDVENMKSPLVAFSPEFERMTSELKKFLFDNLYFGKEISKINGLSKTRMELLFSRFTTKPELMGETAKKRIQIDGIHRAAADYIAGMTDNFAVTEYLRLV